MLRASSSQLDFCFCQSIWTSCLHAFPQSLYLPNCKVISLFHFGARDRLQDVSLVARCVLSFFLILELVRVHVSTRVSGGGGGALSPS